MRCIHAAALCFLLLCSTVNAEIYRWVDGKGRLHFGDKPKTQLPGGAKQEKVELDITPSSWQRFDIKISMFDMELSEAELLRIQKDVNNVYQFYDRVMYFDFYKTVPVSISIYKDKDAYVAYLQGVLGGSVASSSRGVFIGKTNEIVVYMRESRNGTLETIKHETSHAIIASIAPNTPGWLNEGLAEQMEKIDRKDGALVVYRHAENRKRLQDRSNMLSLRKMLDLKSTDWRKANLSSNAYLQAHAGELLYFLLSATPRKSFVSRILQEYKRGNDIRSLYLVRDNYIGDIGGMETGWELWLRQDVADVIYF